VAGVTVRRPNRRAALKHRFVVNFPHELAEQVIKLAGRERRPLSTQIQVLVERALELEDEAKAIVAA